MQQEEQTEAHGDARSGGGGEQAGKHRTASGPQRSILEEEIAKAEFELHRPAHGLFISALLAGLGVTIGPFLRAAVLSLPSGDLPALLIEVLGANAYAVGFIVVILGRTDLFTEYTTMATLPVLTGRSPLRSLVRLWGLVYAGNLLGVAAFSGLIVGVGPALHTIESGAVAEMARGLVAHAWWTILLSGMLTGWLMGLLSWQVSAASHTVSQILFIWIVAATIGFTHLHHCISGSGELLMGLWLTEAVQPADLARFLVWTTLGNIIGSLIFAVLIRYSVVIGGMKSERPASGRARREPHRTERH